MLNKFITLLKKHKNTFPLSTLVKIKRIYSQTKFFVHILYDRFKTTCAFRDNSVQEEHWRKALPRYSKTNSTAWGDPKKIDAELGNYPEILRLISTHIGSMDKSTKTALDLGSYDGKWTFALTQADKIICCDLFSEGFDIIKTKHPNLNLEFILTDGCSLNGVENSSIDLIFSMDTLVRVKKSDIWKYFNEFKRVLKPGGKAIIHLPLVTKYGSFEKMFTPLFPWEIKKISQKTFSQYRIEDTIIKHGIILIGAK